MEAQRLQQGAIVAGRYRLLERLAVGGMAEIYLARQISEIESGFGPSGFEKDVVIKRLRPEFVRDNRIVSMFRDEGQLGAHVSHPNTIHIYDVGLDQGIPFIAMEYIEGEELSALCRRGLKNGHFLPLEHSVWLISQAALSLGHFHAANDARGHALNVVHCDISPTNLMITKDGVVIVIDFGIAQVDGQSQRTDAFVPGKLSYMSPEQARREPLDQRSDIYSLGIVLYEISLGRRLFKGPAQEVVKRLIRGEVKAPTFVNHDYPGSLESIVMRALEPLARDRFSTAFDLVDELQAWLADNRGGAGVGPVSMARYLDGLAVAAGGVRRDELISEREDAFDDDELDFDRGRRGELGTSAQTAAAVAQWDEFEEDEQAVADALGIPLNLVRVQPAVPGEPSSGVSGPQRLVAESNHGSLASLSAAPSASLSSPSAALNLPHGPSFASLDAPKQVAPLVIAAIIGGLVVFFILHLL